MFRAGLILLRRIICAASLLILLVCGAEVGARVFESVTGRSICQSAEGPCSDPSRLSVASWFWFQELKPSASASVPCRDSNTYVHIQTNSLGLRGPEPADPKPANVCRIIVLGDETIFAPETSDADHFCTLLQNQLQRRTRVKLEVINAAIPGHCPLTEYILFKQRLISLQPDLVLLHFDWSDVTDDRQLRRLATCDDAGTPQSCPHPKLAASKKKTLSFEAWRQQFRLFDWAFSNVSSEFKKQITRQKALSRDADMNPYAWLRDEYPEDNVAFREAVRPTANLARLCRSRNFPFVLFTSPKPWQVSAKCSRGDGVRLAAGVSRDAFFSSRVPFEILAEFADRAKIPFVDGSTALITDRDNEANFLQHAPRWSPQGHRQMADLVAQFIHEKTSGAWNSPYFQQDDLPTAKSMREPEILWTRGQSSEPDNSEFIHRDRNLQNVGGRSRQ